MKINKTSWHYKLITGFERRVPNDLCSYVRTVVSCLLVSFVIAAFASLCVAGLWSFVLFFIPWFYVNEFLLIIGVAEVCIIVAGTAGCGISKLVEFVSKHRKKHEDTIIEKEPGIFAEYLKSIKEKTCPMLTFYYPDSESTDNNVQ